VRFFAVFQQNSEKMGEFAASIECSKAKSVSASGGLHPLTPVIGSRSARSPWPPLCQILNTPLAEGLRKRRSAPPYGP